MKGDFIMFCNKCGKQTEGENTLCEECALAESVTVEEAIPVAAPKAPATPFNKKKSVLSMVFGIVSFYLMVSMLMAIPMAKPIIVDMLKDMDQGSNTVVYVADAGPAGAVFIMGGVMAMAFGIVSIIMGALSIVSAVKAMKSGQKVVAGIVMAAVGIVLSVVAIILFFPLVKESLAFMEYLKGLRF